MKRTRGLASLKRHYDALLHEEEARGILPAEQELLDKLPPLSARGEGPTHGGNLIT